MLTPSSAAWVLSVLFGGLAVFYVIAAILNAEFGCRHSGGRSGAFLHAVMAAGMIPMLWTWGMGIPAVVFILVFTAAALWFLSRALFVGGTTRAQPGGWLWYHAAMMGSMVWMAIDMAAMSTMMPSAASSTGAGTMSPSDGQMAGMAMPGVHSVSADMSVPSWAQVGCVLAAAAFGAAALVLTVRSVRLIGERARYGVVSAETARTVMAAGMCVAFVVMV